jgi:hypothetical protein
LTIISFKFFPSKPLEVRDLDLERNFSKRCSTPTTADEMKVPSNRALPAVVGVRVFSVVQSREFVCLTADT